MEMDDSDQEDLERTDTDSTDELSDGDRSPGFRPLRRLPASRHFPYSDRLDAEAAASLQRIKQNLSAALLLQDRVGLQLYLIRLSSYLNVYNVFMSKEDYILLVRLVERCAVSSFSDYRNVDQCGRLLVLLMKRVKRHITRDDLEIEWRPLFDLYVSFSKHPFRGTRFTYQLDATVRTVKSMVRCCRSFFAAGATGELLAVVLPELCLFDSATSWVLDCLELFLPTDLPPALYGSGWRLWLPRLRDIFQLMENSGPWDQMLCSLFSRLAWYNPGQLDWSPLLPDVFSRLLRCFALPIGFRRVSSHHPNAAGIPPLTTWIVAMLGGGSETQTYLERLLEAVGSYFYASNTGPWHDLLSRFLSALCSLFTRRYNRERYMKNTWEHYTADSHCLTDEDVRRFVKAVLPCALLGIYWWSNGPQMCRCLRQLSQLSPDMVIPPVIESFHQSLETITEPHRLTCTMNALTSVLRSMAETGPRPELVPLLQLLLPAIDPNDKHKTMCAFVLIDRLSDIITFVDCSRSADDPALTEMEQQVCLQTAGIEDVVLQMMDRFLGLLEPNNVENTRQDHGRSEKVNQEETVLLSVMRSACFSILIKSSPEIQRLAVHKLKSFVTGTILDSRFSGRLAAVLCCGAIMANYELGLKALLPSVASTIISITEDEQSEEKPDQELIFNLLLLKEMTASCGRWLLPYRDTLELVLLRCRHLVHKEGSSLAADLLYSLLTGLTGTYVTDYGDWRAKLADSDRHHLLIKEWGQCVSMRTLEVQWHQATDEEVTWATQLVEQFLLPELEELELFMNDVSRLNKDQLMCRLHLIHLGLKGAAGSLPPLSGPLADVGECSVDLTTLQMETAVRYLPLSTDLRVRVIDVMHRLLVCLNEHRPDDTKSLSTLAVIMETAVVNHGVKRVENEAEMKVLYDNRLSQGKDIGYKRFSSRVLAAWVQLQHNQRVVFANAIRPTKILCDRVLVDLLALSTSFYSQVRITGQAVLSRCMFSSHQSYLTLWPRVVELLRSPDITHEQLKGVLYVIASNGRRSLLLRRNWEVAAALWPALVTCVVSEKESIVRLIEHIRKETLNYVMVPVQCQFPDTVDQLAMELYSPPPSSESRHQAALRMSAYNADNKQRHADLSNQLIALMENNSLHWRRYELAMDLLSLLVRPEIPPSESFVRLTLNNLLHSSIIVRKSFGLLLGVILKQQKPVHATVTVNPSEVCTLQNPARDWRLQSTEPSDGDGAAGWRNWPQLGERRDNAWLQYDSGTAPCDAAAWLQPRYVHKMKWGYSSWPQQTVVYRQLAEFPTDVNVVEARQVVDFFTDPSSVEKLVNYFSLEENKGMDLFNTHCCTVFKGLARNHGEQVLDSLKPSLNRLAAEPTESAQKCLCEMVAGLVRGSKHWPFASVERLWQYLIPLLRQSIPKIHQETAQNWITCINTCVADRDINRQHWLVEMMLEPMFDCDEALFVTCVRIELLVRMTGEFEWRGAEVMHRIRDMISNQLCHPYQSIRRKLGCLLCKVFAVDVYGGPPTFNPRAAQFLDSVLPKLDVLLTVDSASSAAAVTSSLMETETAGSGQVRSPSPAQPATEAVSQERTDAHRLLQTLCHYVLSSASTRLLRFVGPEHVRLLPALCVMESYDIDRELQTDCVRTLQVMAVLRHDVRCMSALLAALDRVLAHPYWRVRLAALKFLQATAFHNMFQLLNNVDMANKVTECVVKGLHDRRVEVRQMAVQVFSGLLHCGFIEQTQQLRLRTEFARMAAVRLGPRDDRDIYTARLRERHTGVLGLCAFVAASPYDVPAHLPAVLMTLGEHVNDPQPIQGTIRTTMTNFKRTHHENWRLHRQKFSDDQLTVLTDLLVSPSYYA